jgi:heme A synthase
VGWGKGSDLRNFLLSQRSVMAEWLSSLLDSPHFMCVVHVSSMIIINTLKCIVVVHVLRLRPTNDVNLMSRSVRWPAEYKPADR